MPRSFWLKHTVLLFAFALFMRFFYQTAWDFHIENLFFDVATQHFPRKHDALFALVLHQGLKWLMVLIALLSLLLFALSTQFGFLKRYRWLILWGGVGMALSTSVVAIAKHYSLQACPWDLSVYGGDLPYIALWQPVVIGVEAGRCFPAGHSAGGFALLAFYFALIGDYPRLARWMLGLSVGMGLLMGGAQMVRGAHFLSHVLWSGWLVWLVLLVLYMAWRPRVSAH